MADLPILFSAPMVRAILREIEQPGAGKTQTRRTKGVPEIEQQPNGLWHVYTRHGGAAGVEEAQIGSTAAQMLRIQPCDRLWVREAWGGYRGAPTAEEFADGVPVFYRADPEDAAAGIDVWRPSIHMPRWASRLTLYVTEVRVERLQDISEEDAIAEGCPARTYEELAGMDPRGWYADLWDSINGVGSWDTNPWVAAYTFKPVLANIDAAQAQAGEAA